MNGNTHKQHDCPYCWRVLYSKGALTTHMNNEHWKDLEAEAEEAPSMALQEIEGMRLGEIEGMRLK